MITLKKTFLKIVLSVLVIVVVLCPPIPTTFVQIQRQMNGMDALIQPHNFIMKDYVAQHQERSILLDDVKYVYDFNNYGTAEYWATPDETLRNGGDCEDFAILRASILEYVRPKDETVLVHTSSPLPLGLYGHEFVTIRNGTTKESYGEMDLSTFSVLDSFTLAVRCIPVPRQVLIMILLVVVWTWADLKKFVRIRK